MDIGKRFKKWRTENNISVKEIQDKLGIAKSTISSIERGRAIPSIKVLLPICKEFNLSLDWLIENDLASKNELTQDQISIIENYMKLNKKNRMMALEEIDHLLRIQRIEKLK